MTSQVDAVLAIEEDAYLSSLLQHSRKVQLEGDSPVTKLVSGLQTQAAAWLSRLRMPTKKDEEWRFTDLSELLDISFGPATTVTPQQLDIAELTISEASHTRLTFVNGCYNSQLSDLSGLPKGLFVGSLSQLPEQYQEKLAKYLAQTQGGEEVFTSLNTAGFADVAIVWAAANTIVESPIQLLFLSGDESSPTFSQPRVLVVAQPGASLELIEQYAATGENSYFNNAVAEIFIAENATVKHLRWQQEGEKGFHIGKSAIAQARDSHYTCHTISLGGKLARHNLEVYQTGEQITTTLNGLTVVNGKQLADIHSKVSLTQPYSTVNQLHKSLVAGHGRAVFDGKILVPKQAQLTNASQLNRNLLLSPQAHVDTKPQLQITADNVKCSHGATVSQLQADEVFYLRSRGLNEEAARKLLIDAFAAEMLQKIPITSLQQKLATLVAMRTTDT